MRASWLGMVVAALVLCVGAPPARGAEEIPSAAPGPEAPAGLLTWKTKDDLAYQYRMPLERDSQVPACLTILLHGSNLTRGWGFANHSWKTFRPYDIVVSPDGTTPNGKGGFNFLGTSKDAKRLKALIAEIREAVPVRQVFLYGHSQGSFFALYYAGLHPDDVDGVVGHASGTWKGTKRHARAHHQAIVLMHGTQDPVVPYDQSVSAYTPYVDAKYPLVRVRSLEGWNHWPAEHNGPVPHTSQQLAWCEGMTSENPERLRVCLDVLRDVKVKATHDWAATYQVAHRILTREGTPGELRGVAKPVVDAVAALSTKHADLLLGIASDLPTEASDHARHAQLFLANFQGTPGWEHLNAEYGRALEAHHEDALRHFRKHWQARGRNKVKQAYEAGIKAMQAGFMTHWCAASRFRECMKQWAANAPEHKLARKRVAAGEEARKAYEAHFARGWNAYKEVNESIDL